MDPAFAPNSVGDGAPILIQAPAWGPTSDYLALTLAPLFEGFRVVTYDPRNIGSGPRVDTPDAQALGHLVDDLEAVRRQLGLDKFVLAGHSHGAYIAMGYAVRHAEHLAGLLLLNGRLRGEGVGASAEPILRRFDNDPARRSAVELFRATGGTLRRAASDAELAAQMRRLMPVYFYDLAAMRKFARLARGARPPSVAALQRVPQESVAWVEDGLRHVDTPTLVLTGRHDVATTPADAQRIHALMPRAQLEIFERSGHHPWVEEPHRFRRLVGDFLAALELAPDAAAGR